MKTRSGTSGWLLCDRCSATSDRAYSRGSPNELIFRSSTAASDRPTCNVLRALAAAGQHALLRLGLGRHHQLLGLLLRPRQVGLALVLGDLHLDQRVGQLRLHGGVGLGLLQRPLLLGRRPLPLVRLDLLDRQLPQPQLFQQRLDLAAGLGRVRLADQHVHALDVELAELAPQLLARLLLDHVALVQQFQHRLLVGHVAEVAPTASGRASA